MIDQNRAVYEKNNIYEFDNNIILHEYPRRIAEILIKEEAAAQSCLELGIGHGYSTEFFSKFFKKHIVLEGDSKIIDRFRKKFNHIRTEIIETYFEQWDTKEKFDVIIMGFVLEHVDTPTALIQKFKNFLKPNGRMFLAVPNAESLHRRIGFYSGLLNDLTTLSDADLALGHKRYYTLQELRQQILESHLKITREEGIFLKPLTTSQMLQLNISETIMKGFVAAGRDYPELCCSLLVEAEAEHP